MKKERAPGIVEMRVETVMAAGENQMDKEAAEYM